jgi:quercetin dioxygenase-like cupin family protein
MEDSVSQERVQLQPVHIASGEGEARWWLGSLTLLKATAADTGGQLSIIEITEPPGMESPLHVHHREDEAFWILQGDATFKVGDEVIEVHAGDYVFGPRDVPHWYRVGPSGCRMLFILLPGGFEDLVREMSQPAEARVLPPPADEEPDWEKVAAIAARYDIEVLG